MTSKSSLESRMIFLPLCYQMFFFSLNRIIFLSHSQPSIMDDYSRVFACKCKRYVFPDLFCNNNSCNFIHLFRCHVRMACYVLVVNNAFSGMTPSHFGKVS